MILRRDFLKCCAALLLVGLGLTPGARGEDVLYIGDGGDNTVKRFDADTGVPLDAPGLPFVSGLAGPRGVLIDDGRLLVSNQNVNLQIPGEILAFDEATGVPLAPVVSAATKDAPFVPQGIIRGGDDIFVSNLTTANGKSHGEVRRYDALDGTFLGSEETKSVQNKELHPRGIVFGPDGLLYVSLRSLNKDGLGGGVLRFAADGSSEVFIEDEGGPGRLIRPDRLVFGPDGNLYITSFRAVPGDTDSIRIYDGDGDFLGKIDLHNGTTDPRVFAQSLLFGPGGKLFVPVSTSPNPAVSTGEVRRYSSADPLDYDVLVPAGSGALVQPIYMTFGNTNPSTLAYEE
jgi:sugar lactone lactonase YvrE